MMNITNSDQLFEESYSLKNFSLLKFIGSDVESFLQGQITIDLKVVDSNWAHLSSRLDRTGRIQFSFYIYSEDNIYYALSLSEQISRLKQDLEKYVISEDVDFEILDLSGNSLEKWDLVKISKSDVILPIGTKLYRMTSGSALKDVKEINFQPLSFFFEQPDLTNEKKILINESIISVVGLSLNKGCFLGQETASKLLIRGKSTYIPRLILEFKSKESLKEKSYFFENRTYEEYIFHNKIYAKFRFKNEEEKTTFKNLSEKEGLVVFEIDTAVFDIMIQKEKVANFLYEESINLFHQNQHSKAIQMAQTCIELSPLKLEVYELLAQAQSSLGENDEAIATMYHLLEVDPHSFMAHTNLSIFYLKKDNIEKAEEHKALAASKQMAMGSVNQKELDQRKREDQDRRLAMFSEVLEIDSEDEMALSGLANIYLERELFKKSLTYFETLIKMKPQNLDYLFKAGVNYLKAGMKKEASKVLNLALEIAKNKNDSTKSVLIENYLKSIL